MNLFFAFLFQLLYVWQESFFEDEKRSTLYASATLGILLGMNLMFISYLISFLFFGVAIVFLKSYYVFTGIIIVVVTILVLLQKKRYKLLLSKVVQQDRRTFSRYRAIVIAYLVISVIGYIVASYILFNDIYF